MDERIVRFKRCDSRFYPYLEKVLGRLPKEVKEDVLSNEDLQIAAHEDFHDICMVSYDFDHPVKHLVYLNTNILKQPEHRVNCAIIHAIAYYVVGVKENGSQEKEAEALLIKWGFEKELEAVRYCRAVFESEGYKTGYEWAIKQNKDYLLQHFGLYFDEWNETGLGRMSQEQFERLYDQADIPSILAYLPGTRKQRAVEPKEEKISDVFSSDEAIIEGIMAAVKEITFLA